MGKDNRSVHIGSAWRIMFKDLGLDEPSVLRRARLPPTLFDGDGSHISVDEFYALHEAIDAEAKDPTLALKAGSVVSVELFDPALFAALCSPDMNTAADRLGQFKRMVGAFTLDVEIGGEHTLIRYRCKHRPDLPPTKGLAEVVFLLAFARRATRHPIVPLRVHVQQLPSRLAPYVSFFGCRPVQADDYAIVFAATDASRAFLTHNEPMWEAFEPTLRRRMAEADATRAMREQVQNALYELLPSGRTEMKDVARELGIGTRTLQRRLAAEDTTWLAVLGETRERLARHYLRTTKMSPAEVSFLLGFEDPNSLFRAFHRWTGTTPEAWRAGSRAESC